MYTYTPIIYIIPHVYYSNRTTETILFSFRFVYETFTIEYKSNK